MPAVEVVAAIALYVATHALDQAAYRGSLNLPSWVIFGTADAARQILTTLAAAVITVVGVVFSITIVTLTLASTQFGPRMLRNFIRDRGTQFTLGTFVATFVYATLVLISIGPRAGGPDFVPHLSITVAVVLATVSMAVLIYFIHHIASSIQLPRVIASIAGRPFAGDRCRVDGDRCRCHRVRAVRSRADDPPGRKRRDRPRAVERLPPVHPARDADQAGGREGRSDPFAAPAWPVLADHRRKLLAGARGRVLEIGAGTGANLAFYGDGVESLTVVEPDAPMAGRLERKAEQVGRPVELMRAPAEELPFADDSFDVVVSTLVLCTVGDQAKALAELRRVLKPGGRLLFIEHVRAEDAGLARWQDRLNGINRVVARGCNCNRSTVDAIRGAGFAIVDLDHDRLQKVPAFVSPLVVGSAEAA